MKHYCVNWQKKVHNGKIMQFGTCTFMPRNGKTLDEIAELVPCAKNRWGLVGFFGFIFEWTRSKGS